jgi:hypothetical protein
MGQTERSETLALKLQTPGNNPEESTLQFISTFMVYHYKVHFAAAKIN